MTVKLTSEDVSFEMLVSGERVATVCAENHYEVEV